MMNWRLRSAGTEDVQAILALWRDSGAEPTSTDDPEGLMALIDHYGGGPAGVETLAYAIAEARDAVEDVIEPFLLQQGFIQRTPRGRMACAKAYAHLGMTAPKGVGQPAPDLFEE